MNLPANYPAGFLVRDLSNSDLLGAAVGSLSSSIVPPFMSLMLGQVEPVPSCFFLWLFGIPKQSRGHLPFVSRLSQCIRK